MIVSVLLGAVLGVVVCRVLDLCGEAAEATAVQAMPVGVGRMNLDESIRFANPALRQTWGLDGSASPMTWSEITHPDDLDEDRALVARTLAGDIAGYSMAKRYRDPARPGRYLWARLTVALVRGWFGRPSHFLITVTPIEEALRDIRQREHLDAFGELRLAAVGLRDALYAR